MPLILNKRASRILVGLLVSMVPFVARSAAAAEVAPVTAADQPARLTGGFFQLNNFCVPWYWTRKPDNDDLLVEKHIDYGQLVAKLRDELLLNTIVIQDLKYSGPAQNPSEFIPQAWEVKYGDPLVETLREANKNRHAVKVYLGLEYNASLFDALGKDPSVKQALEEQAKNDAKLAHKIAAYCTANNVDFDGWYITTELGNWKWADSDRKAQFKKYVHDVADACISEKPKNLLGEPMIVAISPYFNPISQNMTDIEFGQHVSDILAGSKVTTVMMQDGMGTTSATDIDVHNYFTAVKDKLPPGMTFAADIELFEGGNVGPQSRIFNQLRRQNKLHTKDILGFDILQYLSPVPPTNALENTGKYKVLYGDATAREELYEAMKNLATPSATTRGLK